MTTIEEVRAAAGGFALRSQAELEERLAALIAELPEADADDEDAHCAQIVEVLYALGVERSGALMVAVGMWYGRGGAQ